MEYGDEDEEGRWRCGEEDKCYALVVYSVVSVLENFSCDGFIM